MTSVGIVMPVWNAERYLDETLGMLTHQSHRDFRLIAVDDGSSDASASILRKWRQIAPFDMHVVSQDNRGVAAARNRGLAEVFEPLVALLDCDDCWHPTKLAVQTDHFRQRDEIQAVGCGYQTWSPDVRGRRRSVSFDWSTPSVKSWATFRGPGPLLPSTLMLRTAVLDSIGTFDQSLSTAADLEFAARLVATQRVTSIKTALVRYRMHDAQMHLSHQALSNDYLYLIDKVPFRDSLGLSREEMLASYAAYLSVRSASGRQLAESFAHARRAWRLDPVISIRVVSSALGRATQSW